MANNIRGRTLQKEDKRLFKDRSIMVEEVFGLECQGIERSDQLIKIKRNEIANNTDGVFSRDIHQDNYCTYNKCKHTVLRTEKQVKDIIYKHCKHYKEKVSDIVRSVKVWEGQRDGVRKPYLSMLIPTEVRECSHCEQTRWGQSCAPLEFRRGASTLMKLEEYMKKYPYLDERRPRGAKTIKQIYNWVAGSRKANVKPWLRADLLRSRVHGGLQERVITNIYRQTGECISQANKNGNWYESRTEEALFYDGVKSIDIHSDSYCNTATDNITKQKCFHLNVGVKKVVKRIFYRICPVHPDRNVAYKKEHGTYWKFPSWKEYVQEGRIKTTYASCPICSKKRRSEMKAVSDHYEGRRKKREGQQRKHHVPANKRPKKNPQFAQKSKYCHTV